MAQLVARLVRIEEVRSSNLLRSTTDGVSPAGEAPFLVGGRVRLSEAEPRRAGGQDPGALADDADQNEDSGAGVDDADCSQPPGAGLAEQ